jgi:lipoprotein-releasing system permease protein
MRLAFVLAARYLRARLRQSVLTIGGIALGVLALTTIQAMMGGFGVAFIGTILGTSPHIMVRRQPLEPFEPSSPTRRALQHLQDPLLVEVARTPLPDEPERILGWEGLQQRILEVPGVVATAPTVDGSAIFGFSGVWEPVSVHGILPRRQNAVVELVDKLASGTLDGLERSPNGVVLGYQLAERMRVGVGDRVLALTPDGSPVSLRIVDLYQSNVFEADNSTAWLNLPRAQAILGTGPAVTAIQVRVADHNEADRVARQVELAIGMDAESWMETNENNISLITMFTWIMYIVTGLTMTVAGFGIAGNLITTVSEKSFDIGVLKAMGMKARHIIATFIMLAVLMMLVGVTLGLTTAYFAVEALAHVPTASGSQPGAVVAASDTMPILQSWTLYVISGAFAMVISVIGGLSPALQASRLEPLTIIRSSG